MCKMWNEWGKNGEKCMKIGKVRCAAITTLLIIFLCTKNFLLQIFVLIPCVFFSFLFLLCPHTLQSNTMGKFNISLIHLKCVYFLLILCVFAFFFIQKNFSLLHILCINKTQKNENNLIPICFNSRALLHLAFAMLVLLVVSLF